MEPGSFEKLAKLSDVARAAGVSQGTVSNVFNRPQLVREEVRERVHEVARKLGYKGPDPKGRLLRAGKVNAIGVATMNPLGYFFADPYAREVMQGIAQAATRHGAGISLVSGTSDAGLAWNVQNALVDGFILFCIEGGERLVQLTRDRQLPFVALALGVDDPTVSRIGIDNVAGARLAAEHLAALGHRRFAVLTMPLDERRRAGPISARDLDDAIFATTRDRVVGYLDVLKEHGVDPASVPLIETQNDPQTVRAAMERAFAVPTPPTALLVQSDRAALLAMEWLREHGLSVPGDVSIVGFDGVAEGASASPGLTTVAQPMREIGREAVSAVLDGPGTVQRQTMPLTLVVRGSTAAPGV